MTASSPKRPQPFEDAPNCLLLDAADAGRDRCAELISGHDLASLHLIGVTFTDSPDRWVADLRGRLPRLPASIDLVCVGERARAATAAETVPAPGAGEALAVHAVESPGNLTDLGVTLTRCLDDAADGPTHTTVCFDSVSVLLQHVDVRPAFRFLHTLLPKVAHVEATAHYHLTPALHDAQTANTIKTLFSTVVEADGDHDH